MKKVWTILMSAVLMLSLAACSSQGASEESTGAAAKTTEAEASADTNTSEETTASEETSEEGVLVAYFSWSGNTEQMAQIIAEETGADFFEIVPAVPYTDDYDELLDIAQQEQADNARPELAAQVENWNSYDTVFVGFPKMVERRSHGRLYVSGKL